MKITHEQFGEFYQEYYRKHHGNPQGLRCGQFFFVKFNDLLQNEKNPNLFYETNHRACIDIILEQYIGENQLTLFNMGDDELANTWSWIYFHGMCEQWVSRNQKYDDEASDLVASYTPIESVPNGIHDVLVYDKSATLFLWSGKCLRRGLICLPDDESSMKYAKNCFDSGKDYL